MSDLGRTPPPLSLGGRTRRAGAENLIAAGLDDAHLLAEHRAACDEIKRLRADRALLVAALREAHEGAPDEAIAFRFDAPGARAHEHLRSILSADNATEATP